MKYSHILLAVTEERWALQHAKLQAILDFLADQASGVKYSAEELDARITQKTQADVAKRDGTVAILPLRGVIANRMSMMGDISGGTSCEGFARTFQAAANDGNVKAIILDVDSPGGSVSGSSELAATIYAARRSDRPIVAQVNSLAASAAYWIASACDEIVVTPTGSVGSIGVYGVHTDLSQAMAQEGIKRTLISAGKFKVDGNPYEPLPDEVRDRMQSRVDAAYDMFVRDVARNRNVSLAAVRDGFGQGDTVDAAPAVAEGMADRVGTMEETLQRFGASQFAPPAKRRAFAVERERRALQI